MIITIEHDPAAIIPPVSEQVLSSKVVLASLYKDDAILSSTEHASGMFLVTRIENGSLVVAGDGYSVGIYKSDKGTVEYWLTRCARGRGSIDGLHYNERFMSVLVDMWQVYTAQQYKVTFYICDTIDDVMRVMSDFRYAVDRRTS